MKKSQCFILVSLAAMAVIIFGAIGFFAVFLLTSQNKPPQAAPVQAGSPATPFPLPTAKQPAMEAPRPGFTPQPELADLDRLITAFEYNHSFINWETAPGTRWPVLTATNQDKTAKIYIFGNPVQRVQLEIDYILQGHGVAPLINEVVHQTIPVDQQAEMVKWLETESDAENSEIILGDKRASWVASPDTWILTIGFVKDE